MRHPRACGPRSTTSQKSRKTTAKQTRGVQSQPIAAKVSAESTQCVSNTVLPQLELPVVPVGRRVALEGWTPEMVARASSVQKNQGISCCWNDCHPFNWVPCRIPLSYHKGLNACHSRGVFCSWSCAKAYSVRNNRLNRSGVISMIAVEANRSRRKLKGIGKGLEEVVYVRSVPPREQLRMFGGSLEIEDYRKGLLRYDGTTIGGDDHDPDLIDDLLRMKRVRDDILPVSFIDETTIQSIRCTSMPGSGVIRPIHPDVVLRGQGGKRGANALARNRARNVCTEDSIRKRIQNLNHVSQSTTGTLMSTMGIQIQLM
jgi:hypothetical protein